MARTRNKKYNTVHHLTSRIAHRVYFMKEEERNDFMALVEKVSAFSGIELIGWCIMDNHFHLYVYLPVPPSLTDDEVLERFKLLKGDGNRLLVDEKTYGGCPSSFGTECLTPCAKSEDRKDARAKLAAAVRRRMYSIAEFMRMIKQWFSEDYNQRNGHKGTLWEAVYHDRPMFLPDDTSDYADLRDCLAYIHLNPLRAAISAEFDEYEWSSYTAYRKGNSLAEKGMRFAYSGYNDDQEIVEAHELRMTRLLEQWKRKRAEDIARKRLNGYEMPSDPLTDEAMIVQAAEHAAQVRKESERLNAERQHAEGRMEKRRLVCDQILCEMKLHPDFTGRDIASVIDMPPRTVYRYIAEMRKQGRLPMDAA